MAFHAPVFTKLFCAEMSLVLNFIQIGNTYGKYRYKFIFTPK